MRCPAAKNILPAHPYQNRRPLQHHEKNPAWPLLQISRKSLHTMGLSAPSLQLTTSIYRMGLPRNNAHQRLGGKESSETCPPLQTMSPPEEHGSRGQEVKGKR